MNTQILKPLYQLLLRLLRSSPLPVVLLSAPTLQTRLQLPGQPGPQPELHSTLLPVSTRGHQLPRENLDLGPHLDDFDFRQAAVRVQHDAD